MPPAPIGFGSRRAQKLVLFAHAGCPDSCSAPLVPLSPWHWPPSKVLVYFFTLCSMILAIFLALSSSLILSTETQCLQVFLAPSSPSTDRLQNQKVLSVIPLAETRTKSQLTWHLKLMTQVHGERSRNTPNSTSHRGPLVQHYLATLLMCICVSISNTSCPWIIPSISSLSAWYPASLWYPVIWSPQYR